MSKGGHTHKGKLFAVIGVKVRPGMSNDAKGLLGMSKDAKLRVGISKAA